MAFLNGLIFRACETAGAIARGFGKFKRKVKRHIISSRVGFLIRPMRIRDAMVGLAEFTDRYWPGAVKSASSMRIIRKILSEECGLFTFVKHTKVKKGERWKYSIFEDLDIPKALVAYEAMEKAFLDRFNPRKDRPYTLDDLPSHKGAFCRELYNEIFRLSRGFNRKIDEEAGTGTLPNPDEIEQERLAMVEASATDVSAELIAMESVVAEYERYRFDVVARDVYLRAVRRVKDLRHRIEQRSQAELVFMPGQVFVDPSTGDEFDDEIIDF